MRRPGTDPQNVQMSDVLCDFCRTQWTESIPFIEGHQGSCLCGPCLTAAYTEVVKNGTSTAPAGSTCTMCLEVRRDPGWAGPGHPEAIICKRCINLAATALSKDKDYGWKKP